MKQERHSWWIILLKNRHVRPQPRTGGNETSALNIQTPAIINDNNFTLRIGAYLNGWLIIKYRSIEITRKFNIDDVHRRTSDDVHMSHIILPNGQ